MKRAMVAILCAGASAFAPRSDARSDSASAAKAACVLLTAERIDGGRVELNYRCDFSRYDYAGVPVDIYLGAAAFSPSTSSASGITCASPGACGVEEFLGSGGVYLLDSGFSPRPYAGVVERPSWIGVSFPPAPLDGTAIVEVPGDIEVRFAVALLYSGTAEFIRTDGLPVELSECMSPVTTGGAVQAR